MGAFDQVKSGIPSLDTALDYIRLGDNVVWRVSNLREFRFFVDPYIRQAKADGRKILYIRFADHEPLVEQQFGVEEVKVDLSHRFETFTMRIHNIIEQAGREAFFVFDCLSQLQTAWATDLMMGNFFAVTCPYLFQMDTVAYFPLIRGKHSFQAIAKIRETTQLFLDVYSDRSKIFLRPQKVWNRDSATMFMPHVCEGESGTFNPVRDGVQASHFYTLLSEESGLNTSGNRDAWDRFFDTAKMRYEAGEEIREECSRMCNIMMTRDERLREMVKADFEPADYFQVKARMIGTGMIGGKACGMLLARKIIEKRLPDLAAKMEPHDSFYVGSDVFYTYIVENHFWDLRVRQRREAEYFSLAGEMAESLKNGAFSREQQEQFVTILEYYGTDPYIVRSSSILEDGFGNAFAGKYESVFCSNMGTIKERLSELENAIRIVYASTMSLSALDYRKRRGLAERDEQMALLIQRVSGSYYGHYYMPCAAGVGFSKSPYRTGNREEDSGMLRLVMGLGTSAVDRTEGSYPRLVSLNDPASPVAETSGERHRYSQRMIEVMDRESRTLSRVDPLKLLSLYPRYLKNLLMEHDWDAEAQLRDRGINRDIMFVSCRGLVKQESLMRDMKRMLAAISYEYRFPVDTEFTINLSESGEYVINLLQCRPLQTWKNNVPAKIPALIESEKILLECKGASMGLSRHETIDVLVHIDPVKYYEFPYRDKPQVARAIGAINWMFRDKGKHMCLLSPGRIGTSSPELGVPTSFADISEFDMICEVAESKAGYRPELSYGSHFFQDLVEAGILYTAVFENEHTVRFKPEMLGAYENRLASLLPEYAELADIVHVYLPASGDVELFHDMEQERTVLTVNLGST